MANEHDSLFIPDDEPIESLYPSQARRKPLPIEECSDTSDNEAETVIAIPVVQTRPKKKKKPAIIFAEKACPYPYPPTQERESARARLEKSAEKSAQEDVGVRRANDVLEAAMKRRSARAVRKSGGEGPAVSRRAVGRDKDGSVFANGDRLMGRAAFLRTEPATESKRNGRQLLRPQQRSRDAAAPAPVRKRARATSEESLPEPDTFVMRRKVEDVGKTLFSYFDNDDGDGHDEEEGNERG